MSSLVSQREPLGTLRLILDPHSSLMVLSTASDHTISRQSDYSKITIGPCMARLMSIEGRSTWRSVSGAWSLSICLTFYLRSFIPFNMSLYTFVSMNTSDLSNVSE